MEIHLGKTIVMGCGGRPYQTLFEGNKRKDKKEGKTWEKREHLLDDSKETICWKMKKDALDRNT